MRRLTCIILAIVAIMTGLIAVPEAVGQRRATPVNTPATRTQPRNDERGDSVRALERRRARSTHYHDENGNIVFVDTLTGVEWTDSTLLPAAPPMKYPLIQDLSVGVDVWDPLMRAFGQKYGLAGAWVSLSMHNRYFPTFEAGLGTAKNTPGHANFTYRSPVAPYFRIGMDYNFLYNSNPDYRFFAGVRYGFSPFRFSINDVWLDNSYWGEDTRFDIPSASVFAGWFEFGVGLRVRLFGNLSAGWNIKYHGILHRSHPATGDAWYIPGYGSASSTLGGSFSIIYTIPINRSVRQITPSPESADYFDRPRTSAVSAPSNP